MGLFLENLGTFYWRVPVFTEPKTQCKVKVIPKNAGGLTLGSDVSDVYFAIGPVPKQL